MTRGIRFAIIAGSLLGADISLRVLNLGSGSSGNSTLVETVTTRVLVDAGFNRRETMRRLAALGASVDGVHGILISHEHTDHISGLANLSRSWNAPVFITEGTYAEYRRLTPREELEKIERVETIVPSRRFQVGDIEITAFSIPHDAADPVGFTLQAEGFKVSIVTDLGYLPAHVREHLRGSDLLILESNHDLEMLKVGPYPWHIKQRVMSRTGHLSNHAVSEFLCDGEGFDARARWLVLAHLSENNNNPDLARLSAEEALGRRPQEAAFAGELHIASQRTPLGPFVF
ncbi:MAG TPA: MBL fold metallo-hydrolase [Patescibacteria group bacterium]|nr:MBL fold metallo-hydrolase [Patescibacteria group bacterium]